LPRSSPARSRGRSPPPSSATWPNRCSVGGLAAHVRIGTCSWADEALTKHWYPKSVKSAEERLRYYAEHFSTVEVDSTYYRLPDESMVARWAERTPEGFVMHVKAFGVMTRHPVKKEQLPPDLRDDAPVDDRGRVDRPPREFRGEIFHRFRDALEPLRAAGKLGGTLFQFPPYVVYKPISLDYLAWTREQMGEDEMLVEFRHTSWYEEDPTRSARRSAAVARAPSAWCSSTTRPTRCRSPSATPPTGCSCRAWPTRAPKPASVWCS
jgi:uncharacterized protein YecE (DUF72 family)